MMSCGSARTAGLFLLLCIAAVVQAQSASAPLASRIQDLVARGDLKGARAELDAAVKRVLASGRYIMGEDVGEHERELAVDAVLRRRKLRNIFCACMSWALPAILRSHPQCDRDLH
jgi:hypothetical protein